MSNMQDLDIEAEIKAKGLTAPRVTPEQIDALMENVNYWVHRVDETTTMVSTALLTMPNGDKFTLATEYSACASPANFDFEIGQEIACEKAERSARNMLWLLEGYSLKKAITNV